MNHSTEDSAQHKAKIIYYAKGLSEKEFKDKFHNAKTIVTWIDKNNHQKIKEFNLGKLMDFQTKSK